MDARGRLRRNDSMRLLTANMKQGTGVRSEACRALQAGRAASCVETLRGHKNSTKINPELTPKGRGANHTFVAKYTCCLLGAPRRTKDTIYGWYVFLVRARSIILVELLA